MSEREIEIENAKSDLMQAIKENNFDNAKSILYKFVDYRYLPRRIEFDGISPLMLAAKMGNFEIVKLLVDSGVDVNYINYKSPNKETAYSVAKHHGFQNILKYLEPLTEPSIRRLAEPEKISSDDDLISAIEEGRASKVKKLIKNGCDVNFRVDEGTPLMIAASSGNLEIVKLLVAAGADINELDDDFDSALSYAITSNSQDVVEYLVPLVDPEIRELARGQKSENN
jgi:ankyrin repeat protein